MFEYFFYLQTLNADDRCKKILTTIILENSSTTSLLFLLETAMLQYYKKATAEPAVKQATFFCSCGYETEIYKGHSCTDTCGNVVQF